MFTRRSLLGGNASGNSQLMWELVGKRLQLLREIAPKSRLTLVVQSPDHPGEREERSRSQQVGATLGLEMMIRPVRARIMILTAEREQLIAPVTFTANVFWMSSSETRRSRLSRAMPALPGAQ